MRTAAAAYFLALVLVIGGFLAAGGLPSNETKTRAAQRLAFPAFEMTREVRHGIQTFVDHLTYHGTNRWSHYTEQGPYRQVLESPYGIVQLPWRWFNSIESAQGRNRMREGVTFERTDGAGETVLIVRYADTEERYVFHAGTGIPLEYSESYRGKVVIDQRIVSLVLLDSGEVVR